jgi:probable phosphoglycerate mutase
MIYLIRHGQTVFNAEGRLQGRLDSPLTDLGRDQARAVGALLRARLGSVAASASLESSPQGRAMATAAIMAEALGVRGEVRADERLREVSLGVWEGLTPAQITARWPGLWRSSVRENWADRCPDGESFEAAQARLRDWLAAAPSDQTRIAVSHGVSIGILRGLYLGLGRAETLALQVPQGVVFALDGGAVVSLVAAA